MNNKNTYLIIYDNYGNILVQLGWTDEKPEGVQSIIVELGDRERVDSLDMTTNPPTPVIKEMDDIVENLEIATVELDLRIRALEEAIQNG